MLVNVFLCDLKYTGWLDWDMLSMAFSKLSHNVYQYDRGAKVCSLYGMWQPF